MRAIRCIAAAAFLFASSAHAALISVTADIGWSCGTGTGGFEPGCSPDVERGMMNFVYNTSISDSDASPATGVYSGAIVAFTMTVEQQTRPDLFFTLAPGPNSFNVSTASGDKGFSISLTAQEHSGAYGLVDFIFNGYAVGPSLWPHDSIPAASYWERATAYVAWAVEGPTETDWGINFRAVTLVPVTGTLALLFGGALPLLAGGLLRRRARCDRENSTLGK